MKQGSGIISPSKYGYNIGDKIQSLCFGQSTQRGLKSDYIASTGDEGIITGIDGPYTEILYENGRFGVRYESSSNQNIKVIEKAITNPTYEIY